MKVPVGASIKYCEYRCTTYNAHRSQHLRSLYLTSAPHPWPQHDWWPSSGDAFSITTIHSRYSYGPLKNSCQAEIISRLVQKFIQCILVHIVLHFSPSLLRLREPGLPQCDQAPVRTRVGEPREQLELGVEVRLPPAGARGRGRGGVGGGELYPHLIIFALPCIPSLAIQQIQRSHLLNKTYYHNITLFNIRFVISNYGWQKDQKHCHGCAAAQLLKYDPPALLPGSSGAAAALRCLHNVLNKVVEENNLENDIAVVTLLKSNKPIYSDLFQKFTFFQRVDTTTPNGPMQCALQLSW